MSEVDVFSPRYQVRFLEIIIKSSVKTYITVNDLLNIGMYRLINEEKRTEKMETALKMTWC